MTADDERAAVVAFLERGRDRAHAEAAELRARDERDARAMRFVAAAYDTAASSVRRRDHHRRR